MPHRIVFPVVLPYIPGNERCTGAPGTTVRPYGARAGQKADLARYTRVYPVPQGELFSLRLSARVYQGEQFSLRVYSTL